MGFAINANHFRFFIEFDQHIAEPGFDIDCIGVSEISALTNAVSFTKMPLHWHYSLIILHNFP